MIVIEMPIWGRNIKLQVGFEAYDEETVLPEQINGLHAILESWDVVNDSMERVRSYCLDSFPDDSEYIQNHEIFGYVRPSQLFIGRDVSHRHVYLLCECRFDPEDGLAVHFVDEQLEEVGSQQIAI